MGKKLRAWLAENRKKVGTPTQSELAAAGMARNRNMFTPEARAKGKNRVTLSSDPDTIMYRVFRNNWRTYASPNKTAERNMNKAMKRGNMQIVNKYEKWLHKYHGGHYEEFSASGFPEEAGDVSDYMRRQEKEKGRAPDTGARLKKRMRMLPPDSAWVDSMNESDLPFSPISRVDPKQYMRAAPSPQGSSTVTVREHDPAAWEGETSSTPRRARDSSWMESATFDTDDVVQDAPGNVRPPGNIGSTGGDPLPSGSAPVASGDGGGGGGAPQEARQEGMEEAEDAGVQPPALPPRDPQVYPNDVYGADATSKWDAHKATAEQFNAERQVGYDEAAANPQGQPNLNKRLQVPRQIRRATQLPQVTDTYHGPYDRGTLQPYVNLTEMGYQGVGGLHVYTGMTAAQVNRTNAKRKRQGYILYDDVAKEWTHIKKKDIPTTRSSEMSAVISQALKKRKISEDAGGPLTGWEHEMREQKEFQQSHATMDHANTQQPGDLRPKPR